MSQLPSKTDKLDLVAYLYKNLEDSTGAQLVSKSHGFGNPSIL